MVARASVTRYNQNWPLSPRIGTLEHGVAQPSSALHWTMGNLTDKAEVAPSIIYYVFGQTF